jgi:hypothetical protein
MELKTIIRNNPLLMNVTIDKWGNEFYYKLAGDGLSYNLFSFGKDNTPNTEDDIKLENLTPLK